MPRLSLRILAATLAACGVFPLANVLSDGRAVPWYGAAVREWSERGLLILLATAHPPLLRLVDTIPSGRVFRATGARAAPIKPVP